jgi:hypothetical protein
MKLPTDLQILEYIHNHYLKEYQKQIKIINNNEPKEIFIEIDIFKIAENLSSNNVSLYNRFFNYLNPKYSNSEKNIKLFSSSNMKLKVVFDGYTYEKTKNEKEIIEVNFPYLESILATLRHEDYRITKSERRSRISLIIAIVSILLSLFINFEKIFALFQ